MVALPWLLIDFPSKTLLSKFIASWGSIDDDGPSGMGDNSDRPRSFPSSFYAVFADCFSVSIVVVR
jgi:hypothetical protein